MVVQYSTLSGHEWASYSSYEDHIKTELKLESKSTILDGSQHRFIVSNARLWLDNAKIWENNIFEKKIGAFISIQGVRGANVFQKSIFSIFDIFLICLDIFWTCRGSLGECFGMLWVVFWTVLEALFGHILAGKKTSQNRSGVIFPGISSAN